MFEENINQEFRLKNIDEKKNYFLEEIKQNELLSKKHKNICTNSKYIENWMCFNFGFAFLLGIPIEITSSSIGLKICAIAAGVKKV